MHYFIGGSLQDKLTGIERALINRLNLFKEMHLEVRLIFTKHGPWNFFHAKKFGIEDVYLSVYDYFQEISFENTKNNQINPQKLFTGLHFLEEKMVLNITIKIITYANMLVFIMIHQY